jgi:hypothetical protein
MINTLSINWDPEHIISNRIGRKNQIGFIIASGMYGYGTSSKVEAIL